MAGDVDDLSIRRDWFGCNNIATPGGLCEVGDADRIQEMYCNVEIEHDRHRLDD